jgi:hypothetical protein
MTPEQKAVLAHTLIDPDAWLANAVSSFGAERAEILLVEKVATWQTSYDSASVLPGYKTRAERDVVVLSPEAIAEAARVRSINDAIASDNTIQSLKAMTNSEFDTWWAANVTNAAQAIQVLKRVARVVIRRVL